LRRARSIVELLLVIGIISTIALASWFVVRSVGQAIQSSHNSFGAKLENLYASTATKQIGRFFSGRIVNEPKVESFLQALRSRFAAQEQKLLRVTSMSNLAILVIHDPTINAVTLPGGTIIIFSGLIDTLSTSDELAAVVAHELGHIVHDDIAKALNRRLGLQVASIFLGDSSGALADSLIAQLLDTHYGRQAETAADAFAVSLLSACELPPHAMGSALTSLSKAMAATPQIQVPMLQDHPETRQRIEHTKQLSDSLPTTIKPIPCDWDAFKKACNSKSIGNKQ